MSGRASDDETLDRLLPGVRSAALEMNTMMRITVATDGGVKGLGALRIDRIVGRVHPFDVRAKLGLSGEIAPRSIPVRPHPQQPRQEGATAIERGPRRLGRNQPPRDLLQSRSRDFVAGEPQHAAKRSTARGRMGIFAGSIPYIRIRRLNAIEAGSANRTKTGVAIEAATIRPTVGLDGQR